MMNETALQLASIDQSDDGYPQLLEAIRRRFKKAISDSDTPLFVTDAFGLYDLFLKHLPAEARQEYNCNACRDFVDRYGGLVCIDPSSGCTESALWGTEEETPLFFRNSVQAILERVRNASVIGVFVPSRASLGIAQTGRWEHMSVTLPANRVHSGTVKTADQVVSEKKEDFRMLFPYVQKYSRNSVQTIQTALHYLETGMLTRGEKFIPEANWLLDILYSLRRTRKWKNIIWYKVATAPTGYCHISNSVLGALIDDIDTGLDFDEIKNRFDAKMDPLKYQRPQAAPAEENILQAEKIVAQLGIKDSLKRRFARLDEVQKLWEPTSVGNNAGVFGNVKSKQRSRPGVQIASKTITMTWEKFRRTVLPKSLEIEFFAKAGYSSYGALVTAQYPDAPPIIKWDMRDKRNPVSWYVYAIGSRPERWNVEPNSYVPVTAITLQPSMWEDESDIYGNGKSVFFLLKGAKDTCYHHSGAALFPEILQSELREIRSTIEAYSRTEVLAGFDAASACGLRLQSGTDWDAHFRVTTANGIALYRLDRWD